MRRRSPIAAAFLSVLLCAAPAAAASFPSAPALLSGVSRLDGDLVLLGQGSSGSGPLGRPDLSELRFENSDGYAITVVASGQTVALSVGHRHGHRKDGRVSTTTYLAHGKVTPTSIRASFGERGRIELRFQPSGVAVRASRKAGCRRSSDRVLADLGVFAGELRFHGEGGYTSAEVHRVRGRSIDLRALSACLAGAVPRGGRAVLPSANLPWGFHLPDAEIGTRQTARPQAPGVPTHPSTGPKTTTLLTDLKLPLARTIFGARSRGNGRTRFIALDERSEGPIGIVRFVNVAAPNSAFSFDGPLSRAAVTPPAPFSGTGAYRQGPGNAKSWAGSLAVSFLGAPDVPLTGSAFSIRLARGF